MFISEAFAQTAETTAQGAAVSPAGSMIFQLVFIVFVVYFILIRPQQKRIKKHEAELNAIIKGTEVIVSGLVGRVIEVKDDQKLLVEFADGVQMVVLRPYVSQVIFETPNATKKK